MIHLVNITQDNWLEAVHLSVQEDQKGFLDSPLGILARGYVYRDCRARVWGVSADDCLVGLALVRDMDEEPAAYDLQQFMIDRRYQGRGYGTAALAAYIRHYLDQGVRELYLETWSGNARMLGCAAKLGFVECGREAGVRLVDGMAYDSLSYRLDVAAFLSRSKENA